MVSERRCLTLNNADYQYPKDKLKLFNIWGNFLSFYINKHKKQ